MYYNDPRPLIKKPKLSISEKKAIIDKDKRDFRILLIVIGCFCLGALACPIDSDDFYKNMSSYNCSC